MLTVVLEQITWLAIAPSATETVLVQKAYVFPRAEGQECAKRTRLYLQQDSNEIKKVSDWLTPLFLILINKEILLPEAGPPWDLQHSIPVASWKAKGRKIKLAPQVMVTLQWQTLWLLLCDTFVVPQSTEGIKKTTLGNFHRAGVPPPTPLLQNVILHCPFPWSNTLLLHQTILGTWSGKPEAFLPHYLSFPRNEEQILFPSSLSCIRMLPRKCKKERLCPQPTSEDTWSVQLFGH